MKFSQREIVLLPFPYSDMSSIKKRPVLIISNNTYNSKFSDIIVLAITSKQFEDQYSVHLTNKDLEYGLLPEQSIIKVSKIFTASQSQVLKKFSIITPDKFQNVVDVLCKLVDKK